MKSKIPPANPFLQLLAHRERWRPGAAVLPQLQLDRALPDREHPVKSASGSHPKVAAHQRAG